MRSIDLNCDMGELMPGQQSNNDAEIMPYISSCNIACGFHSGNPALINKTICLAKEHGVKIGAHPSYNDRKNFGRKSILVNHDLLEAELTYQIAAVKGMVESIGEQLHHVKPHGALYNDMVKHISLARLVVRTIRKIAPKVKIYGLAGSHVAQVCKEEGMAFYHEAFADRAYETKTELRNRKLEGALIVNEKLVIKQVQNLINGKVMTYSGLTEKLVVDSICLHSDTPGAIQLSKHIYLSLIEMNVVIGK